MVLKSSLAIIYHYLKAILILLRLLQLLCLHGQKSYEEQQVPFILWCSLLNAIKSGEVKLGSRHEYIFPVDTTNKSYFNMGVINTDKTCTSALLNLFGQGQTFWHKIGNNIYTSVCAKGNGNTGKKHSFQPDKPSTMALHNHSKALVSMSEV